MGKSSISSVAEFSIIYDEKELKTIPIVSRKRLIRKKFKKHYLSSGQKLACTQTLGSTFLDRIRKVQTQNMNLICSKKLIVLLMVMVLLIVSMSIFLLIFENFFIKM